MIIQRKIELGFTPRTREFSGLNLDFYQQKNWPSPDDFQEKNSNEICQELEMKSKLIDKILHTHIHSDSEANLPIIENKKLQQQIISKL